MLTGPHERATGAAGQGNHQLPRLSRLQQLTLNTWRRAAAAVARDIPPSDILAQAAITAVGAVIRDCHTPAALFARHAVSVEEFALIASLAAPQHQRERIHDLLDMAFLLRWSELTRDGLGPEELPPLARRPCGHQPLLP